MAAWRVAAFCVPLLASILQLLWKFEHDRSEDFWLISILVTSLYADFVLKVWKFIKTRYLSYLQIENMKTSLTFLFLQNCYPCLLKFLFFGVKFFRKISKSSIYKIQSLHKKHNRLHVRELGKEQTHTKFQKDIYFWRFYSKL